MVKGFAVIIDDIDFGTLYQQHLHQVASKPKTASDWDKKAYSMVADPGCKNDSYISAFIEKMNLQGANSLLDVGCGPGTICLPLAGNFKEVYALDYSPGMLQVLKDTAQTLGIGNVQCFQKAWEDDWADVPICDIVVASRATLVQDIKQAICKLNRKAKRFIYTTHTVDRHFIDGDIMHAIGRKSPGLPNYIYTVNILNQMGLRPHVDYIDTLIDKPQPKDFEQLLSSVEWSIGKLAPNEKQALYSYFEKRSAQGLPVNRTSRAWAYVWWSPQGE